MPIQAFDDNTFVAFIDISGFKFLISQNDKAFQALDLFYQTGYRVLHDATAVEGFFISDCGILFTRGGSVDEQLNNLLNAVRQVNRRMAQGQYMLTTSIAYGRFSYHDRVEFRGIEKNPLYGLAYLTAYLDNSDPKRKLEPGQCRIVTANLPMLVERLLAENLLLKRKGNHHLYYYWNLNRPDQIPRFESEYNDAYTKKYLGMMSAITNHLQD